MALWRVLVARPFTAPRASLPLALAALWPILQLLLGSTIYRPATASAALDWGVYLLVFLLAGELFGEAPARLWFLQAASLFGLSLAVVATIGEFACPGQVFCLVQTGFAGGVMGPFINRNQYCAWVELLLPASLYLAAVKPRLRVLFGTAAAAMAGSVVASASRAGTVLVAAELAAVIPVLAVRYGVSRRRLLVGGAQFLVLAGIAISVVGWQEVLGRWRNAGPEDLRQDALRASLRMVQDRPWTGSGLGTWPRVYPRYATIDRGVFMNQAHNDWAQWTAEGGLPFLLLFFFFVALSWKPALQSIYGTGMVVFLLHALVDYPMQQRPALGAWFFCMAGVAVARRRGGHAES
jgi:O-antigen ligase